jgi:YdjC-like protein
MHPRTLLLSCVLLIMVGQILGQSNTVAGRLGYPDRSKLLIVHADDLAVAHSVDAASFDALDKNAVTSASIMMPCPWTTEVAAYAKAHPDADLGLHIYERVEELPLGTGCAFGSGKQPSRSCRYFVEQHTPGDAACQS